MTWSTRKVNMLLLKVTEKNSRPKGYGGSTLFEDPTSSHCNSSSSRHLLTVRNLAAEMNNTKGIHNSSIKADTWNQDLLAKHIPYLKQAQPLSFFLKDDIQPGFLHSSSPDKFFLLLAWAPHFQPAGELPGPMVKPCLSQILALATQSQHRIHQSQRH